MSTEMRVRATKAGTYGPDNNFRDPGEEFALRDPEHFSHAWMAAIDWEPPAPNLPPARGPATAQASTARVAALEQQMAELRVEMRAELAALRELIED